MYGNYIERIQSLHLESGYYYNWNEIAQKECPPIPKMQNLKKNLAQKSFEAYKPSFFDKLFKKIEKRKMQLKSSIEIGEQEDKSTHEKALLEFKKKKAQWAEEIQLAKDVLNFKENIYEKIINEVNPFSEIKEIGSELKLNVLSKDFIEVNLNVNGQEIVPDEKKTLLTSGKLSVKKMPKGDFNEIYQDYVCSCALRIANELFLLLPVQSVNISAMTKMINTKTGYLEDTPILAVLVHKKTLEGLNLEKIDPSDSMDNFICNMEFKRTIGMKKIERIDSSKYIL